MARTAGTGSGKATVTENFQRVAAMTPGCCAPRPPDGAAPARRQSYPRPPFCTDTSIPFLCLFPKGDLCFID